MKARGDPRHSDIAHEIHQRPGSEPHLTLIPARRSRSDQPTSLTTER